MHQQKGFTLLEILIVVVIASSVLAFALPAHRRAQDRNKYLSAVAVLQDLGQAVQAKRTDLSMHNSTQVYPSGVVSFTDGSDLILEGYLQEVGFESDDTYKDYKFFICPTTASSSECCGNNAKYIACMKDPNATTRASEGLYAGARFLRSGQIEQFSVNP